jgi:transcriptional regulator with XRE-family HTH domain
MAYKRIQKRISANLRRIREALGISQQEAAARCGMATQQYSKIEGGKANITIATLAQLTDQLGLDVGELFEPLPTE